LYKLKRNCEGSIVSTGMANNGFIINDAFPLLTL